jgi:hypothetical protein
MADWLLDPITHDLVVSTGDVQFTSGTDTVRQRLDLRANAFKGEWFLDLDNGLLEIDTDGTVKQGDTSVVLGGKYDQARVTAAFRKMLIETEGVDLIRELNVSFDGTTRTSSFSWTVKAGDDYISGSLDI